MAFKSIQVALILLLIALNYASVDYEGNFNGPILFIIPFLSSILFVFVAGVIRRKSQDRIQYFLYAIFLLISSLLMSITVIMQSFVAATYMHCVYYLYILYCFFILTTFKKDIAAIIPVVTLFWSLYIVVTFIQYPHFELGMWIGITVAHAIYIVCCSYIYMSRFKLQNPEE